MMPTVDRGLRDGCQDDRRLPLAMRDHAFSERGLESLRAAAKVVPIVIARLTANPSCVIDLTESAPNKIAEADDADR